jgi:XRE family transcriptional regulator, fatty acid utilization regulator
VTIADRLKYARHRSGLTLRQVVARTEIGESSLSEFENGKREPRLSQLQNLAEVYRRQIGFFLGEGEIPREVVLWRERPAPEIAVEIEAEFLKLCQQYQNLEAWTTDHGSCELPKTTGSPESFGYREAEKLAYDVQSELRLGDRPGRSLFPILEEVCGVKLFHLPFEPTGTAASTVSESFGAAVLLNRNNVRWRRNFDLAHELFHLLTWDIFRYAEDCDNNLASEKEEKLANCFASHLLMPADATQIAVNEVAKDGKISFLDLFDIARQFDVSGDALLWRLHSLFRREKQDTERDIERYRAASKSWEDREHDQPPERPARFVALVVKAFRNGEMSQGKVAEYLGISRRDAARIAEQEALDDEEITISAA